MSILVNVFVPEGIIMASDSRLTTTSYDSYGNKIEDYTDNSVKGHILFAQNVGITHCGCANIGEQNVSVWVNEFVQKNVGETDKITDIVNKLLEELKKCNAINTSFYIGGYIENDPYFYCIKELQLRRMNFGGPLNTILYSYLADGQPQYLNKLLDRGKKAPDFNEMTLSEAEEFAKQMILYTYDEQEKVNEHYCGGNIDIIGIQVGSIKKIE